jgi:peptide deformylase
MQLITYPNPKLRVKCNPINDKNVKTKHRLELARQMWDIMFEKGGVGLAAPQVGLCIRMFIWKNVGSCKAIWNPILSRISGNIKSIEGCLSLPGITVSKQRATSSVLQGQSFNGVQMYFTGDATITRVWQHEIDHLDGKLIIDNM